MQSPDTIDAPIVPYTPADTDAPDDESVSTPSARVASDGGRRPPERPFDRPPLTDHATEFTRDQEEIEPFVADLR